MKKLLLISFVFCLGSTCFAQNTKKIQKQNLQQKNPSKVVSLKVMMEKEKQAKASAVQLNDRREETVPVKNH